MENEKKENQLGYTQWSHFFDVLASDELDSQRKQAKNDELIALLQKEGPEKSFEFDGAAHVENIALEKGYFDTHLCGFVIGEQKVKLTIFAPVEANSLESSPQRNVDIFVPVFGAEKELAELSLVVRFAGYEIVEGERLCYLEVVGFSEQADLMNFFDFLLLISEREKLNEKVGVCVG